jgi:hypothetical protein
MQNRTASDAVQDAKLVKKQTKMALPVRRLAVRAIESLNVRPYDFDPPEKFRNGEVEGQPCFD